jgi:hypothetical protein
LKCACMENIRHQLIFSPISIGFLHTQSLSTPFHDTHYFLNKEEKNSLWLRACMVLFVFCYVFLSLLTKSCKLYSFCLVFSITITILWLFGFQFHFKCSFLLIFSKEESSYLNFILINKVNFDYPFGPLKWKTMRNWDLLYCGGANLLYKVQKYIRLPFSFSSLLLFSFFSYAAIIFCIMLL